MMRFAFLSFLLCAALQAATWPAASGSRADVEAAIALASDGDTVTIPAGDETWTSNLTFTKAITLQGAGVGHIIIRDGIPDANADGLADAALLSVTLKANLNTRITGIEFADGSVAGINYNGVITFSGSTVDSRRLILDNCKFTNLDGANCFFYTVLGVVADCEFDMRGGRIPLYVYHENWDGVSYSDNSWADPPDFGSEKWLFIEDTIIDRPDNYAATDAYRGARYVIRHSTLINAWVEAHGTDSGGRSRGTRAVEVYENTFQGTTTNNGYIGNIRSGTGLFYNNTVTGFTSPKITLSAYRVFWPFSPWGVADGTSAWDVNEPGGPFESGTATGGSTTTMVDTSKSWTTNQWAGYAIKATTGHQVELVQTASRIASNTSDTITYADDGGYAFGDTTKRLTFASGRGYEIYKVNEAFDQPGRGQGTQLSGASPTPPASNDQVDEPLYEWNNLQGATNIQFSANQGLLIRSGEHYFNDTQMPGYTPYTYPHPLRGVEASTRNPGRKAKAGRVLNK